MPEIPLNEEGDDMANDGTCSEQCDLPKGVLTELLRSGVSSHQQLMAESAGNIQHTNNLARVVATQKVQEVGSIEARAVDRVLDANQDG